MAKSNDSAILSLPGRRKKAESSKKASKQKSKKSTKKRKEKALLPSDAEKSDNEILKFMGEEEEGEQEVKIMCGKCRQWSKPAKINIAVNVDKEASLLWHCNRCRRYNDITIGMVETRA